MALDAFLDDPRERRIWAKGHRLMVERGYGRPGHELEAVEFCEKMALAFPKQAAAWHEEAAQWHTPERIVTREADPTLTEMLEAVHRVRSLRQSQQALQTLRQRRSQEPGRGVTAGPSW